jgi:hypothetical protein
MAFEADQQNLGSISQGMELNISFREAFNRT